MSQFRATTDGAPVARLTDLAPVPARRRVPRPPAAVAIDVSPLAWPWTGIGRSVAGLMRDLPALCADAGVVLRPFAYRSWRWPEHAALPLLRHLPLPRSADAVIRGLRLVERLCPATLYHATDFYLPLRPATPLLATIHDVIYALAPERLPDQARIAREVARHVGQCVRVIACSQYSADEFCALYDFPPARVRVVPWGMDTAAFCPGPPAAPDQTPYFLAVSCSVTRKNTPRLLHAFLDYVAAGGRYDLTLAWTLPPALAQAVRAAGAGGRVHALGTVDEARLCRLYQQAKAVMFPSLYEGFGFPVLEALACGVPVVTTRCSALPELGGDLACYVDGHDTHALVREMFAFERGERSAVIARVAREGPRRAACYSWQACAEKTLAVYLEALSAVSGGGPP